MNNKKILLSIFFFILAFFVFNESVLGADYAYKCTYNLLENEDNPIENKEKNVSLAFLEKTDGNNEVFYIVDYYSASKTIFESTNETSFGARLLKTIEAKEEDSIFQSSKINECPTYIARYQPDSNFNSGLNKKVNFHVIDAKNNVRALEMATDLRKNSISKAESTFVYKISSEASFEEVDMNKEESIACTYDRHIVNFPGGTPEWNLDNPSERKIEFKFKLKEIKNGVKILDGNMWIEIDGKKHFYGDNSDYKKEAFVNSNECPKYLVETKKDYFLLSSEYYIDAYNGLDETAIRALAINAKNESAVYYTIKGSNIAETDDIVAIGECSYYKGNSSLILKFSRGTTANNTNYYSINAEYFFKRNFDKVILRVDVSKFSDDDYGKLERIIDGEDGKQCSIFPYLEVEEAIRDKKTGGTINISFKDDTTDYKKIFKYFKLAKTESEAANYSAHLSRARNVLQNMIYIVRHDSMSEDMKRRAILDMLEEIRERSDILGREGQSLDNLFSYLSNGGKFNTAIYDYSSYWLAMATNYASFYVIYSDDGECSICEDAIKGDDETGSTYESCLANVETNSKCLKFKALEFVEYIRENVENGYISIPGGCEMLSEDLIKFLGWGLRIIRYAALVAAVVLGMLDFIKAIAENDEKSFQKAGSKFIKRIVVVILIILSAVFIQFILVNYALPGIGEDEISLCDITDYS